MAIGQCHCPFPLSYRAIQEQSHRFTLEGLSRLVLPAFGAEFGVSSKKMRSPVPWISGVWPALVVSIPW